MAGIQNFVERSEKISQLNGRPDRLSADHMRASRHWGWAVPLCGLLLLLLSMATPGCLALSQDFSARLVREKLPSVEKDYPGFSEMMKMCAEKFEVLTGYRQGTCRGRVAVAALLLLLHVLSLYMP
eukprot:GHVS01002623.1.p1 GENE.GHVS01002623.1~~GHVS01002623.1.p1  ORF type:complete len:126 (+),score=9.68 GHVS01002623.1:286-663(+)